MYWSQINTDDNATLLLFIYVSINPLESDRLIEKIFCDFCLWI
jgi:hypothetical protein